MTKRSRGPVCLATAVVMLAAALSGCAQPELPTTITGASSDVPKYFSPSADGAFLVTGGRAFTVASPGAKAVVAPCCDPPSKPNGADGDLLTLRSGSVALDGKPWVVLDDGSAIGLDGKEHGTAAAVRKLHQIVTVARPGAGGGSATTERVNRWVQNRAVSVIDEDTVLVASYTTPGSTLLHANDSVVYRVSASGVPTAVAGRSGLGSVRPVAGLRVGEHVAATEVDLKRVQALVALDQNLFVLFMIAPTSDADSGRPRLQAALVAGGQISRLELPDLCANEASVVASRLSGHEVVLNALKASGDCVNDAEDAWIRLDTAKNTAAEVGSGDGFAGIAGDQLLTSTTKIDLGQGSSTTVAWQPLS